MHAASSNNCHKKTISFNCSYNNNYTGIYEPVYDQNIIFYDEEEDEFDDYIDTLPIDFYEA